LAVFVLDKRNKPLNKFNRSRFGIPKTHALDAACVGEVGTLVGWQIPSMEIKASGRGD
jgi:hypothetical protein